MWFYKRVIEPDERCHKSACRMLEESYLTMLKKDDLTSEEREHFTSDFNKWLEGREEKAIEISKDNYKLGRGVGFVEGMSAIIGTTFALEFVTTVIKNAIKNK